MYVCIHCIQGIPRKSTQLYVKQIGARQLVNSTHNIIHVFY